MSVTLLGFPWDGSSSYARGPALAPQIIRSVLQSTASSPNSLSGVPYTDAISSYDFDALPEEGEAMRDTIKQRVGGVLASGSKPLSLGGDHSITFPILEAVRDSHGPVNILHIDAHPDLYPEFDGDRFSHACPFARAVESGCIANLVQVGIRSTSNVQKEFAAAHNIVQLGAEEFGQIPYERLQAPLYVSIDLDGIDPAFAPGVSHPEPGGLSTREVLKILQNLKSAPVGADIVELNPNNDLGMATANVAARLVKELAAMLAAP